MKPSTRADYKLIRGIDLLNLRQVREALKEMANTEAGHQEDNQTAGKIETGLLILAKKQSNKLGAKKRICAIAELLIRSGADVNARDEKKNSPLLLAVETKKISLAKLLIKHKANVNAKDKEGISSLLLATSKKQFSLVKLLLDGGANVLMKDACGYSALSISLRGDGEITDLLLSRGADPNDFYEKNRTPLMLMVAKNNYRMVKMLLGKKVNVQTRSEATEDSPGGETALNISLREKMNKITKLLLKKGARLEDHPMDVVPCLNSWLCSYFKVRQPARKNS
jgi:ankyrin repeat protein